MLANDTIAPVFNNVTDVYKTMQMKGATPDMQPPEKELKRTALILCEKYYFYMIPALLSAVGVSLSEFADSLIVSRLLNADSFAIVNLGIPIAFLAFMIVSITGVGGSLLYAEHLAKKERDKADTYYASSMVLAFASGILLFAIFMILRPWLGNIFGCPEELRTGFDKYINFLCYFVPVGILMMNITYFLPITGRPALSMLLVVSVNVLNIILDVVLIRYLGMDCEGAAAATLVSYLVVLAAEFLLCRFLRVPLRLQWKGLGRQQFKEIILKGFPSGIVQAGYAVTTVFCNYFMNVSFGVAGVMAMSLFGQMDSIISIALSGIIDNNASFTAMLKGEGDYYGIRKLTRNITVLTVLTCSFISVCFVCFSSNIAAIFNIYDANALRLITVLTPVYVLYYPLRCLLLILKNLYNALDWSRYASLLGILDKVVSIPVVGGCLYLAFGGYGLIAAFPVSMVLILLLVLIVNRYIINKSGGRYSPVLLLDEQNPEKALCSFTVRTLEDAAAIGISIKENIKENVIRSEFLNRICLAVEEICTYIHDSCGADTPVDIIVSSASRGPFITCRSPGKPFYPIKTDTREMSVNELFLVKMFRIRHEYIFGLNSTRLSIGKNEE